MHARRIVADRVAGFRRRQLPRLLTLGYFALLQTMFIVVSVAAGFLDVRRFKDLRDPSEGCHFRDFRGVLARPL